VVWCDMTWCDVMWYDMIYVIWYDMKRYMIWYDMIWYDTRFDIYLLTAIGLTPGGSSTVHIYTQTIHRTTQLTKHRTTHLTTNWEECRPCPVFASYNLVFALQLRKSIEKHQSVVAEECQLALWKQNIQSRTRMTRRIHKHNNKNT